jgi:signal transduction histidine kinase
MNRRILIQVATPAVLIGLLLCGACLVSAWHVNRLQAGLSNILAQNVSSMQAAQELEINARQLRFHCFLYLIDPDPGLLRDIQDDHEGFETWCVRAEQAASTPDEQKQVRAIREGYDRYRAEFRRAKAEVARDGPKRDYRRLADAHPIRHVTDPCRDYLRTNEELMDHATQESGLFTRRLHLTLLLLALGGPLGGLISGYGIARGLSRSLYRLSVRIQDMAQQLDRDVAAVHLTPDGDLQHLDRQMEHVVRRVTEVTRHLQQQHNGILRAQQLAAVGQLAASVAHEVRNPLTSIKMLVEAALRDHKPRPFTQDNLRIVHGEVLRLEQTVQGFLDFARPPALQRRPSDLRSVVAQAVELVRARARQQKVRLDTSGPEGPLFAEVDPGQLCTVLVNLLVNALDAMPRGGDLFVRLEGIEEASVALSVLDTGEGICPEMVETLFTPFASTKPTGSGLGLSICKRIIEEHCGTITAANQPGGGACFRIALPQSAQPSAPVPPTPASNSLPHALRARPERVPGRSSSS